ncbi:MAG: outer membrane lipid asymmetry maintenance protein MlaD [Allosphingosinicella sp.]
MTRNLIETVMGAVVLVVAATFVYFAYSTAQIRTLPGYEVSAAFFKVGGLNVGSDVRISGVKVGTVLERRLDPATFDAIVVMSVANEIKLPEDTVAAIASEGLLGGKYVSLEPGKAGTFVGPGARLRETRSFKSLEDQVGEIIFLATSKPDGPAPGAPGEPSP